MKHLGIVLCIPLAWIAIHFLLPNAKKSSKTNRKTLPPGPPALPIVGNLLSLAGKPHSALANLAKTHGPLMMVQLGQVPTVVISSAAMAKEAIQNHDQSISSRTVIDAVRAVNHHQKSIVWLPAEPEWQKLYDISISKIFSTDRLDASQIIRNKIAKDLISEIQQYCNDGKMVDIGELASTTTLNLLTSTLFSEDLNDPNSEYAHDIKETVRGVMDESGTPNLADYFPVLRTIDPQRIRRRMSSHFLKMNDLFNNIINQRSEGKTPSCPYAAQPNDALDALLNINKDSPEEIDPSYIPHLLTDFLAAGADSTSTTVTWAMTELLHNPEKLQKAKAELDKIIGNGNPIEESHIDKLPYLQSIIKETLRLHPSVPLSVPRRADSDTNISGYTIPKNAQILINVWAIGRDPEIWERPISFEPERFLGSEVEVVGGDFEMVPFGLGRRVCPGWEMAVRMIHLMVGSMINGFEWKVEGGEKMDVEEKLKFTLEKAHPLRAIPFLF